MREGKMRVAAVHASPAYFNLQESISLSVKWIEEAGRSGVEVLVFPESFLPGFPYFINLVPPPQFGSLYLDLVKNCVPSCDIENALSEIMHSARENSCAVMMGLQEFDGGTIYNSLAFIDSSGDLSLTRRKLVPTGAERTVWGYGDGSTLLTVKSQTGVTLSGMMCWEHMMPLARHALARANPRIHGALWPGLRGVTGLTATYERQVDLLAGSFALSSQAFVVSAMNPIDETTVQFIRARLPDEAGTRISASGACSTIYAPTGEILEQYSGYEECLVIAEADLDLCLHMKRVADSGGHFARNEILHLEVDRTPYSQRLPE
jgi:predicted amidohydrolase